MKKTIFKDNKTLSSVVLEAVLFAVSSVLVLTFLAAVLTLILNLIY